MVEENNKNNEEEVEDIFSEVPSADFSTPAPKKIVVQKQAIKKNKAYSLSKRAWLIIGLAGLSIILIIIIVFYLQNFISPKTVNDNSNMLNSIGATNVNSLPLNLNSSIILNINSGGPINDKPVYIDSDNDGLSDEAEMQYNTSPNKKDSDSDGLSDREEVKVYLTDPLDNDSDNDGFLDGEEVEGGYNPLGQGYLIDFQSELDKKLNT